ncbi:MAG TPA: hypothetical protein VL547_07160 [Dinghuibacter sp.]|uniref:hypothetical protein n=1 Tax=Dinghuibacter sp. TaxID=2024697 RepID=UPI002BCA7489|nr:hypothetical protein [Dinghuibacter sp.]HTJ11785.1 hypothetical protein [Dinghuibacter sp.]
MKPRYLLLLLLAGCHPAPDKMPATNASSRDTAAVAQAQDTVAPATVPVEWARLVRNGDTIRAIALYDTAPKGNSSPTCSTSAGTIRPSSI